MAEADGVGVGDCVADVDGVGVGDCVADVDGVGVGVGLGAGIATPLFH